MYGKFHCIREQPTLDLSLGNRYRPPPRRLEVMTQFPEIMLAHFADYVQSSPTFWEYTDSGPEGDQDYFNGDDASLQQYCVSCFVILYLCK